MSTGPGPPPPPPGPEFLAPTMSGGPRRGGVCSAGQPLVGRGLATSRLSPLPLRMFPGMDNSPRNEAGWERAHRAWLPDPTSGLKTHTALGPQVPLPATGGCAQGQVSRRCPSPTGLPSSLVSLPSPQLQSLPRSSQLVGATLPAAAGSTRQVP